MTETDPSVLAAQYADAENLNARIRLHEEFEVAEQDWWDWVFDHYEIPPETDVFEVGCGPGYLWRDNAERVPSGWGLLLSDFSPGMVEEVSETVRTAGIEASVCVAAAESLPLASERVDVVIANHMLYHTDRASAIREIRRVLRPGGRLYATTNSKTNLRELRTLLDGIRENDPVDAAEFSLESGAAQLEPHFEDVNRYVRESRLVVPTAEPLVAYAASLPGIAEREITAFATRATDAVAEGPLTIQKEMGLFEAVKAE